MIEVASKFMAAIAATGLFIAPAIAAGKYQLFDRELRTPMSLWHRGLAAVFSASVSLAPSRSRRHALPALLQF